MTNDYEYFIVPYDLYGVKMWAIEDMNGYTLRYCNSKKDAEDYIKEWTKHNKNEPRANTGG